MRRKKNTEERFYEIKRLDELKERVNDLNRQNEEDQALIQDENTTPSEREAAEARRAERNEEFKLRLMKESLKCLSEKEYARSSKNMA